MHFGQCGPNDTLYEFTKSIISPGYWIVLSGGPSVQFCLSEVLLVPYGPSASYWRRPTKQIPLMQETSCFELKPW